MGRLFRKQKEPWGEFLVKAWALASVLLVIALFTARYHFAFDSQEDRCLPDYRFYLIDKWDTKMVRHNLYAFRGEGVEPVFRDGQGMLKKLAGLPGDRVEIDNTEQILINNELIATGLAAAEKLGQANSAFYGQGEIGPGRYWFTGETENSFDSRYWGTVSDDQIIGRAHPIF